MGDQWKKWGIGGVVIVVLAVASDSLSLFDRFFGQRPSTAESGLPAAASGAPVTPCNEIVRRGFECTPEDLVNALANPDPETIRLFVDAGFDGYSLVEGHNVFGSVYQSNRRGFEALVDAMIDRRVFARYADRQCRGEEAIPLALAASYDFFPEAQRCEILRQDTCLSQSVEDVQTISNAQVANYQANHEYYGRMNVCVDMLQASPRRNLYRINFGLDFNAESCLMQDDPRACAVAACEGDVLPQYRRKFPTVDAYAENAWEPDDETRDEWYFNGRRLAALLESCNIQPR